MFWVLYVMFVLVSASGLMATAQIALIAKDYHVADTVIFLGGTTLTVALLVDNVTNGAARPLFGWISDHIGRENTMAIAFGLGGVSYWLLGSAGTSPWAFVLFAGLIFLTWGEIFSLFPSTCTDTFGPKFATTNLSLLYTAKGASAFLVPLANVLKIGDRELARGVCRHGADEFPGRRAGAFRAEADALAAPRCAGAAFCLGRVEGAFSRRRGCRPRQAAGPRPGGRARGSAAPSRATRGKRRAAASGSESPNTCPPGRRRAAEINDALLDRPAIDVEAVGQIAEPRRRHRRQLRD